MSPAAVFERVYHALRSMLESGRFRPGDRLEPVLLAEELNSSITPVRDALHRLVGERLVDASRGDGFAVPRLNEARLRDLYAWNLQLLLIALRMESSHFTSSRVLAGAEGGDVNREAEPAEATGRFFADLAEGTGNIEHVAAIESLNSRLRLTRRTEAEFIEDWEAELNSLLEAARSGEAGMLRKLLIRYHQRRQKAVPLLVSFLDRSVR